MVRYLLSASLLATLVLTGSSGAYADDPLQPGEILIMYAPDAPSIAQLLRVDPVTLEWAFASPPLTHSAIENTSFAVGSIRTVYIADSDQVLQLDIVDQTVTTLSQGGLLEVDASAGIALEPSGDLVVYNGAKIVRIDPSTGTQSLVSEGGSLFVGVEGVPALGGLAVDREGYIYASGVPIPQAQSPSGVLQIDPVTGDQGFVTNGPYFNPVFDIEATADKLYFSDGTLKYMDLPCCGSEVPFGPGSVLIWDLAVEANGDVIVDNLWEEALRIEAETGSNELVFDPYSIAGTRAQMFVEVVEAECSDGIDNDRDGNVDWAFFTGDTECTGPNDASELSECSDAVDNDGDGLKDLADPDCRNADDPTERPRQCSDGVDNDGDGDVDLDDPNCNNNPERNNERPGCGHSISPVRGLNGWSLAAMLLLFVLFRRHPSRRA